MAEVDHIGREGIVIAPQFVIADAFEDGRARVLGGDKWGVIDKNGEYVANPTFDDVRTFNDGLAAVKQQGKWGFIDRNGQLAIPAQFSDVSDAGGSETGFEDGFAVVTIGEWRARTDVNGHHTIDETPRVGVIDRSGRYILTPQFESIGPFNDGLAVVRTGGKHGYVDRAGKLAINTQFDEASAFSNGLALVRIGDRYGYVDTVGAIVINPQFDAAASFVGDRARVQMDQKWGFIDRSGVIVISPQFDSAEDFVEGLAEVIMEDTRGYVDASGTVVRQLTRMYSAAPPAAEAVLDRTYPGWRYTPVDAYGLQLSHSEMQPHAMSGDVDGDGQLDHAVRIVTKASDESTNGVAEDRIIALLSRGAGFIPYDVGQGEYLAIAKKGERVGTTEDYAVLLANDAIATGRMESHGWIYVYRNGRWWCPGC